MDLIADAFGLIDLTDEEGGYHGGHTIRDHVGKSEDYLQSQLAVRQKEIISERGKEFASDLTLGSFPSLEAATKIVSSTLAAHQSTVENFLKESAPFLRVESYFSSETGMEAYARTPASEIVIRTTSGGAVIVRPDPTSLRGFRILTAFPIR